MRFLYQPIIPPRMVAMGFPSRRSESLVLCGRTEAADAITVVFGEKVRGRVRFEKTVRRVPLQTQKWWRWEANVTPFLQSNAVRRSDAIDRILGLY